MKPSNTEKLFLILSLLTLILAGSFYLFFARNHIGNALTQKETQTVQKSNMLSKAIDALEKAEKKPSLEAIEKAEKAINQLKKTDTKLRLQERLNQLKKAFSIEKEAIKALEEAEKNPSLETKDKAKEAIDKIGNLTKKNELLNRLGAIVISDQAPESNSTSSEAASDTTISDANTGNAEQATIYESPVAPAESYVPQAPAQSVGEPVQPATPSTPTPSPEAPSTPPTVPATDTPSESNPNP